MAENYKGYKGTVLLDLESKERAEKLGFHRVTTGETLSLDFDLFGGQGMVHSIIIYIENGLDPEFDEEEKLRHLDLLKLYVNQGLEKNNY